MRKLIVSILCLMSGLFITQNVHAQELGIRFGDALGNDASAAIDGVFAIGKFSRVHADVSFGDGIGVEALYDFIYKPVGGEAFSWYMGVGVSLFLGDPFLLGVPGELGLEYHFNNVPIAVGADWRPVFILVEDTDFDAGGFGLNLRWVFSQ